MRKTWFTSGDWNAICDVCGFKFKASQLKLRWDGLMVCDKDWETRHPQEFIRPIPDQQKLPWTRPEGTDTFIPTCTLEGRSSIAGYAVAGCMVAGMAMRGTASFCTVEGILPQADVGTADCAIVDF